MECRGRGELDELKPHESPKGERGKAYEAGFLKSQFATSSLNKAENLKIWFSKTGHNL